MFFSRRLTEKWTALCGLTWHDIMGPLLPNFQQLPDLVANNDSNIGN
jgi:hypothetical protein